MRITLFAALLALAACRDPVAPGGAQIAPSTRIVGLKGPNFEYSTDYTALSTVVTDQSPGEWCRSQLDFQADRWAGGQHQLLTWDDWVQTGSLSGRTSDGVAVSGTFRIKFRSYIGTYGGQPIQCMRTTGLYMDRFRNMPYASGQAADPATQFWAQNQNWSFCFGSVCASNPAHIHVQAAVHFVRQCDIDVWPSTCVQYVDLGQLVLFTNESTNGFNDGEWDIYVRADGWWTVYNYGGNLYRDLGYWSVQPGGYYLQDSYHYSFTTNYFPNRAGQTHWRLTG